MNTCIHALEHDKNPQFARKLSTKFYMGGFRPLMDNQFLHKEKSIKYLFNSLILWYIQFIKIRGVRIYIWEGLGRGGTVLIHPPLPTWSM